MKIYVNNTTSPKTTTTTTTTTTTSLRHVTSINEKNTSDWVFFLIPIVVTCLIFLFVIGWICLKKRGQQPWTQVLSCRTIKEGVHKDTVDETVTHSDHNDSDHNGSQATLKDEDGELLERFPKDSFSRTRSSCPPDVTLVQAVDVPSTNDPSVNDGPYYTYVDHTLNATKKLANKNKRLFCSENDLLFLQKTGTSMGKFMTSLGDLSREKFASYVIIEGSEEVPYKRPSGVPKHTAPTTCPPSPPLNVRKPRCSVDSFTEIHLSDLQIHTSSSHNVNLRTDSTQINNKVSSCDHSPQINHENGPWPYSSKDKCINAEKTKCTDTREGVKADAIPNVPCSNSTEVQKKFPKGQCPNTPKQILVNSPKQSFKQKPLPDSPIIDPNESISFPVPTVAVDVQAMTTGDSLNNHNHDDTKETSHHCNGVHLLIQNGGPTTNIPQRHIKTRDVYYTEHRLRDFTEHTHYKPSFKQRELPRTPTDDVSTPTTDSEDSGTYTDTTKLGMKNSVYESLTVYETKAYLNLLPNGKESF